MWCSLTCGRGVRIICGMCPRHTHLSLFSPLNRTEPAVRIGYGRIHEQRLTFNPIESLTITLQPRGQFCVYSSSPLPPPPLTKPETLPPSSCGKHFHSIIPTQTSTQKPKDTLIHIPVDNVIRNQGTY